MKNVKKLFLLMISISVLIISCEKEINVDEEIAKAETTFETKQQNHPTYTVSCVGPCYGLDHVACELYTGRNGNGQYAYCGCQGSCKLVVVENKAVKKNGSVEKNEIYTNFYSEFQEYLKNIGEGEATLTSLDINTIDGITHEVYTFRKKDGTFDELVFESK